MIDKLEAQRRWEYEYVCLQATENSVGFYERMGFKRIGCIVRDAPAPKVRVCEDQSEELRRRVYLDNDDVHGRILL